MALVGLRAHGSEGRSRQLLPQLSATGYAHLRVCRPGGHAGHVLGLTAEAYAMYRPDVWGRSQSAQVSISAERLVERPILAGDFDRDCRLTDFDASLVAAEWNERILSEAEREERAGQNPGSRDLNLDSRLSASDIAQAQSRARTQEGTCTSPIAASPVRSAEQSLDLSLAVPADLRAGQEFEASLMLEIDRTSGAAGPDLGVGAWQAKLELPAGIEFLGFALEDEALALGPAVQADGREIELGAWWTDENSAGDGRVVIARLQLRALDATPATIEIPEAEFSTADGRIYEVQADGALVSPEPWEAIDMVYLPSLVKDEALR